jgi:hypothetical protein
MNEEFIWIGGVATALNLIFIMVKYKLKRISDAGLDLAVLIVLSFLFSGTISGLGMAMIASSIFSIYLFISPPEDIF